MKDWIKKILKSKKKEVVIRKKESERKQENEIPSKMISNRFGKAIERLADK